MSGVACCKAPVEPDSARSCAKWSVVFCVLSVVIWVVLIVFVLVGIFVLHVDFVTEWMKEISVSNPNRSIAKRVAYRASSIEKNIAACNLYRATLCWRCVCI